MKMLNIKRFGLLVIAIVVFLAGCARSPQAKEAQFLKRGQELMEKHDYQRATLEFRNASQLMANDAEPYYRMALVFVAQRDAAAAIRLLQKATQLNPKHAQAQLELANLVLGSASPDSVRDAQDRIRKVLAESPDAPGALDTLAVSELRLGNFDAAVADLQTAVAKAPGNLRGAVNLAQLRLLRKDPGGAETVLKKAVESAPKSAPAMIVLANFYVEQGRTADAETTLQRALATEPDNPNALLLLASLQSRGGRPGQAELTYKRVAALPGQQYKSLYGVFLFQERKRAVAIQELEAVHKRDLDNRTARGYLVSAYAAEGRVSDALAVLNAALRRRPKDSDALLQRGELYLRNGSLQQAHDDLESALHNTRDSAEAHYAMARVYELLGAVLLARQELDQALHFNPALLAARTAYARILASSGDVTGAFSVLDHAPADQRRTISYITSRNWVLLAADKRAEVRPGIEAGLSIARTPDLLYQEALLDTREKGFAKARTTLRELLGAYPESAPAIDLLASTYSSEGDARGAVGIVSEYAGRRPKAAPLQNLLGLWLLKTGDRTAARAAFQKARDADPAYTRPTLLLAQVDLDDGNVDAVRRDLAALLAKEPNDAEARFLMGAAEDRAGNYAAAIDQYQKVLQQKPSDVLALNNLAYDMATQNPHEALDYIQRALALAPNDPSLQDTIGLVYYSQGSYTQAVKYLNEALYKAETPGRRFHLGLAYAKLGDRAAAAKNINAALKLDPHITEREGRWLSSVAPGSR
jgi:tetratricopeptide (TPR) repeat protein